MSKELESAQKACAEMRDALSEAQRNILAHHSITVIVKSYEEGLTGSCPVCDDGKFRRYDLALSSDCGRDYVHKYKVKPLVEAIEKLNGYGRADMGHQQMCDYVNEVCEEALAKAKEAVL